MRALLRSLCAVTLALALWAVPVTAHAATILFDAGSDYLYNGWQGNSPSNALSNSDYQWMSYQQTSEREITYNGYDWTHGAYNDGGQSCTFASLTSGQYYGIGYLSTSCIFPKGSKFTFVSSNASYLGRMVSGQSGSNAVYNGEYRWTFVEPAYCHIWVRNRANGSWKDMTNAGVGSDGYYSIDFNADAFCVLYSWSTIPIPSLCSVAANTVRVDRPVAVVTVPESLTVTLDQNAIDLSTIEDALHAYGTLGPSGTSENHSVAEYVRNTLHTLLRIEDNQVSNSSIASQTSSINSNIDQETQAQTNTLMDTSGASGISLNLGETVVNGLGGVNDVLNLGSGAIDYVSDELDSFVLPSFTWSVNDVALVTPSFSIDIWETFPNFETICKTACTSLFVIAFINGVRRWYDRIFMHNAAFVFMEDGDVELFDTIF